MSNTYTWIFGPLDCIPSADGLTNIVKVVHWRYNGTDGTHHASVYGTVALDEPQSADFIAFEDLTAGIVEGWVANKLEVDKLQDSLDKTIADLVNPPIVSNPPPWSVQPIS